MNSEKQVGLYSSEIYLFPKDLVRRDRFSFDFSLSLNPEKLPAPVVTEDRHLLDTQRDLHKLAEFAAAKLAMIKAIDSRSRHLSHHCSLLLSACSVVVTNHTRFVSSQRDSFSDFQQRFQQQEAFIAQELNEFDRHLEKLRAVPLHPALVLEGKRHTLGDLLDGGQLAACKEKFLMEQMRLREQVAEVEGEVKRLEVRKSTVPMPEAGGIVDTSEESAQLTEVIETYVEYRQLLEQYLPEMDAAAGRRLFEEAWTPRISRLRSLLSSVEAREADLLRLLETQKSQSLQVAHYFLDVMKTSLSSIAKIRYGVKSQISMLNSLLKRFEQRMQYLLAPKMLPTAYAATLCEVARRQKFIAKADELRKELLALIDQETTLRVDFWNKYRNVLPNDLMPQLGEAPDRKYLVPKSDSDRTLPAIDVPCAVPATYYTREDRSQFDALATALESSRNEVTSLHTELAAERSLRSSLQVLSESLQSQVQSLESQLVLSQEHKRASAAEISSLKSANSLLATGLDERTKELEEVRSRLEVSLGTSVNLLESLKLPLQPEAGLNVLKDKVLQLKTDNYKLRKKLKETIFFVNFPEGALALFFPQADGNFVAFHYNCPCQYVDFQAIEEPLSSSLRYIPLSQRPFLLGKILRRTEHTASAEYNPFALPTGTNFALLTIEIDARFS